MKKIIKKAIIFVFILIIISLSIDSIISKSIAHGEYYDGWNYLYSDSSNSQLVLFGSSRCQVHFDPQIIENQLNIKCYNMGITGAKIDIHNYAIKEYLNKCNTKPQYISLVVDIHALNFESNTIIHHDRFFPYILFNSNFYKVLNKYEGFNVLYFCVPLLRYSGYLNKHIDSEPTTKGYHPYQMQFSSNTKNTPTSYKFDSISTQKYLLEIIQKCKNENIKLNLVFAPEYKDGKNIKNRDIILSFYKEIAKNNNIPFKDFSQDSILNNDTTYFYNIIHLNKRGAEKFTKEMYVPWIKELYGL